MVVIVFLVDTSASMNQKTAQGISYLDLAKNSIFTFMKYRGRDPASRSDRYMLVTLDDPPSSIKVGLLRWLNSFPNELKNLTARGISTLSHGLKEALDLLNIERLQTGIDQYGQGRNPFFLDPAVIIAITDGGKYMKNGNSNSCVIEDEILFPPCGSYSGSELTKEMFRWDQRLFTILLKIPGIVSTDTSNDTAEDPTFDHFSSLCEYSGGKCYSATSVKTLYQIMESISQKMFPGVVLNFRKITSEPLENSFQGWKMREKSLRSKSSNPQDGGGAQTADDNSREVSPPDKSTNWYNLKKMIYVRSKPGGVSVGHWPIPESFWPELSNGTLPPRDVHPVVWFEDKDVSPMLLENFAFDKYEMEPSPLTQQLLAKRNPSICWEVFISDSGRERGLSHPFGYLKASSSGSFVNLFVMPFNYRRLLPLIEELQKQRLKPTSKWRADFADYVSTVPSYYAQPLRKSLQLMGAHPGLVPESFDGSMSYTITNYLRKLKKQSEMDTNELSRQEMHSTKKSSKVNEINGNGISISIGSTDIEVNVMESLSSQSYRNPFDISRSSLLEQISRMRTNFLHSSVNTARLIEEVDKHQVPIGLMGNYQQYLKKLDPLRELDTGAVRTQLFGNPFKLEKASDKTNVADEMMVEHMKRPGSPTTRESHRMKRRHSHSPSPMPHSTPPASPHATATTNQRNKTSTPLVGVSKEEKAADVPPTNDKPKTDSIVANSTEANRHTVVIPEKRPATPITANRKRSPSPTLSAPHPKRSNRDIIRTDSLMKQGNEKSPSPSPLLTAPVRQTGLSSASQVLNEEFKRKQTTQNLKLKQAICKEIRKNSKSYEMIFQNLESVQGSVEAKKLFVKEIIKEAERFRKKQLIQYLEEWMTKLSSSSTGTTKIDVNRSVKNSNKINTSQR